MTKHKLLINSTAALFTSLFVLSGCSTFSQAGKSVRSMTTFGQQSNGGGIAINEELVIPPSLRTPATTTKSPARTASTRQTNQQRPKTTKSRSNRNYYVVVGTYDNQPKAFDTFVRLSSIGLPGATMESRKAKSGQLLHMVRLGPYQKQEDIDKVTNNLTSDGLTQFKVVEN